MRVPLLVLEAPDGTGNSGDDAASALRGPDRQRVNRAHPGISGGANGMLPATRNGCGVCKGATMKLRRWVVGLIVVLSLFGAGCGDGDDDGDDFTSQASSQLG